MNAYAAEWVWVGLNRRDMQRVAANRLESF
jgi:hypothetical protein